jgi:predicted permease
VLRAFRIAARTLAKTPGLSLSAIALLAVGIGGGTLLFSAFEAVWLRPLPVRHPEQLVRMVQDVAPLGKRSNFSYKYYRALKEHSTTLSAAFGELETTAAMSQPAPAEQVRVGIVTPEFFDELGAHALYGRTIGANDTNAVVLSYGFWQRRFTSDPTAIGRTIVLHGFSFAIAGVMPREFNGLSADTTPEVRAPAAALPHLARYRGSSPNAAPADLSEFSLDLAGRMKRGVTREQAQAECFAIWRASLQGRADAALELKRGMMLDPLEHGVSIVRDKYGTAVRLLAAASGVLLLLVCANVAGLMLAGAAARRSEIAVRLALGATRARLVSQMITESLMLVAAGAIGGWALAWICAPVLAGNLPLLRDLATTPLALSLDFHPNGRVMAIAMGASALMALLVGIVPAVAASRTNLDTVLRGVRASQAWEGRRTLVIVQVALSTVLVGGAGLLARTLFELRGLDPGFDAAHIVTFTTDPSLMGYTAAQSQALWTNLAARVRELPGVLAVAESARPLMRGSGLKTTVAAPGQTPEFLNTSANTVTPEYFDAMGMHVVRGRGLNQSDVTASKPTPVVVNETFARRFYPNGDPIGGVFGIGLSPSTPPDRLIVGVVKDAKYRGLREPMTPTFYTAAASGFSVLSVRTHGAPTALIEPVRKTLASLDPALPFTEVHTLSEEVETSIAPERLTATLAVSFGAFAAFLAAAGIYGLLAFAVEQRRREIGIRMALGAQPRQIGGMLGRETALLLAAGLTLGLAATYLVTGTLGTLLYGVAPHDPLSLTGAAVFMLMVAAAATFIPARRATGIPPAAALRV